MSEGLIKSFGRKISHFIIVISALGIGLRSDYSSYLAECGANNL